MKEKEREALIWASLSGLSNTNLTFIYGHIEEFVNFYLTGKITELVHPHWPKKLLEELELAYKKDIQKKYQTLDSMCINTLVIEDDFYPEELALSANPPMVLYTMGMIDVLEKSIFGIVGARKHTNYGARICKELTRKLMEYDVCSISGMALGIDSIVHRVSIDSGKNTIAVLGNGIDDYYPRSNYHLWEDIKKNGLIISEYPPGTPPYPGNFPERNRIIASLSKALLVIEAKEKSGSLITARMAAESGKDVFSVPGNIDSIYSKGTNRLIQDGAFPLIDFESLVIRYPSIFNCKKNNNLDIGLDLGEDEKIVFKAIESGIQNLDMLSLKLSLDTPTILSCLTMLELKGYITGVDTDNLLIISK